MRVYQIQGEGESVIKGGAFFEEGDVLELAAANKETIRGIVELKGNNQCKLRFCSFSNPEKRQAIGREVRIFYNEEITFNGTKIKTVNKIPDGEYWTEGNLRSMMDEALRTKDEDWFNGLMKKLKRNVLNGKK